MQVCPPLLSARRLRGLLHLHPVSDAERQRGAHGHQADVAGHTLKFRSAVSLTLLTNKITFRKNRYIFSDLTRPLSPFRDLMNFVSIGDRDTSLRYGSLVLPNVVNNFGPTYLARIHRID